ncbi:hypothetical protein KY333_02825 [Candidatus Woesearchaeota archaeon]|nr:hypothetical protein [Candidatus Woesearchaeota archaeon]MBW2994470.1 hypothetical protein [Candidatus Woesearchaeota archaeon]
MAYQFIQSDDEAHDYQLVWTRWVRDPKQYDIYIDVNPFGKLNLTAEYRGERISSNYKSASEATGLVRLLRKMGIKKRDLQGTSFSDCKHAGMIDKWGHLVNWLATSSECK